MLVKYFDSNNNEDFWLWTLLSSIHVKDTVNLDDKSKNGIWIRCVFDSLNDRPNLIGDIRGLGAPVHSNVRRGHVKHPSLDFSQNLDNPNPHNFGY